MTIPKKQIKYKGKTFKYIMRYAGYFIYGHSDRRIMVTEYGTVVHQYKFTEPLRINTEERCQLEKRPGRKPDLTS